MASRLNIPSQLQWQLLLRRVDPWLLAALLVCIAGAVLQWGVLPAIERYAHPLGDQTASNLTWMKTNLTEKRLRAFRDRLVSEDQRTEILEKFFAEAAKSGITLQQGEYALTTDTEGNFSRFQISLPMKGSYPRIRAYAETLLEAIPALSLDEIGFRRDSVQIPSVEARLRFTLYMKGRDGS